MKHITKTIKGALALTLAAALFTTTAYAAETTKDGVRIATAPTEVAETVLPTLTYDAALEKAKKHSTTLRELSELNDHLEDVKFDLWSENGGYSLPNYSYQQWASPYVYAYTSGLYSTQSNMAKNRYNQEMLKVATEATVKNYFASILTNEDNLALLKTNAEMEKTAYKQGQTKFELGLISKYALDQLKTTAEQTEIKVNQLVQSLEQQYINLNNVMGEKLENRYTLESNVTYEPYELKGTLENYIADKTQRDYGILLEQQALEDAKFNANYLSENVSNTERKNDSFAYDSAKRSLKDAKAQKAIDIRNAYISIQQLDASISSAQADLAKAQADLKAAEVNYQAGNTTKVKVDQAKMGVTKAENALQDLVYDYDMLVFSFQNTSLLGGTAGGSAGGGASK